MKKYFIFLIFTLFVFLGCDALGIKQADNNTENNSENIYTSSSLDNQMSASDGIHLASEEILRLQEEIEELINTVNAKDITIVELENKLQILVDDKQRSAAAYAMIDAELSNIKETISINNQYRNIAIIVAIISLLFNILLIYLLIRKSIRSKRAALPPAKDDVNNDTINKKDNADKDEDAETNVKKISKDNTQEENSALQDKQEDISYTDNNEQPAKRRGRPKTSESSRKKSKKDKIDENV